MPKSLMLIIGGTRLLKRQGEPLLEEAPRLAELVVKAKDRSSLSNYVGDHMQII